MAIRERIPPSVKAATIVVLGIGLCVFPVLVAASGVGERVQHYESAEVVANDSSIWYESRDPRLYDRQVSDEIACLGDYNVRICQFEESALRRGGVETSVRVSAPEVRFTSMMGEARYVQIDGRLYERTYPTNETESGYVVRFEHEPANGERVLGEVAKNIEYVPPEVAAAAREGEATSRNDVAVPETPVVTSDGEYYRVRQRNSDLPPRSDDWLTWLSALSPLGGVALLVGLWRRTQITFEFD